MNIDFAELGIYCQNRYKESLDGKNNKYIKTWFVAIEDNNNILISTTPHILKNATKCILIHERISLAVSNWYEWYKIEFINELGEVLDSRIDEEFELRIIACGGYANQMMEIANNRVHHSWKYPWESAIKEMWSLYLRLKEAETEKERILISDAFYKDNKILQLEKENADFKFQNDLIEKERDMYKSILDEIKQMLES